jgi:hypothetical protein
LAPGGRRGDLGAACRQSHVEQKVFATVLGSRERSVVVDQFWVTSNGLPRVGWLCLVVSPVGPSGFQRHDRAGRYLEDGRVGFLRYVADAQRVEVNTSWGPVFDTAPRSVGCYGNPNNDRNPDRYAVVNPFRDLVERAALNGQHEATDHLAGLCSAVFAWPFELTDTDPTFELVVKLPVDDYCGADSDEILLADAQTMEDSNRAFWAGKLDQDGLQARLPESVGHLFDLFRFCRAMLLILSDDGEIHPGPTIYDSFWALVLTSSDGGGDLHRECPQFGTTVRSAADPDVPNYL